MLSGNPFMHDYMVFSIDRSSPMPERTDQATSTKIGKFYFWAFKSEVATTEAEAQEPEVVAPQLMPSTPPEVPV